MTALLSPSRERLSELFTLLAGIPSPSRKERGVADAVVSALRSIGVDAVEDDTGPAIGGDCGNLLCRIGPSGGTPCIALGAHLDTVPVSGPIDVVLEDGERFVNANDGILGADDKAAVAALVHAAELMVKSGADHPSFELFFTVCEEEGLVGASHLAPDALKSPLAAVIDSSGPVGGIVAGAPSQKVLRARFRGTAAHAGIEPELGRSAIQAAAKAVEGMKLGRLDAETTANVGTIRGGSAINVIPDYCEITGECRGHDESRLADVAASMLDAVHLAATECEVDVEVELVDEFRAYRLDPDAHVVSIAKGAATDLGIVPSLHIAGGGSDANILNSKGIPTVNLAAGMMRVHSPDEYVTLDELERLCRLALHLVERAGDVAAVSGSQGGSSRQD